MTTDVNTYWEVVNRYKLINSDCSKAWITRYLVNGQKTYVVWESGFPQDVRIEQFEDLNQAKKYFEEKYL